MQTDSETAKARSGSVQPDCSAVLSALDTLCRKAEQDEYFRIWKDYPLGCGPLTTSIAREAGMSLQTTRRHLIKLEWAGHVNAKRTSGGTTRWWCPPNNQGEPQPPTTGVADRKNV